ncbi:hypothetical protein SAY87_002899 [Trapa incisa]|uniref:F-box domain-containing protein n=1 Tax=Trapa incisa TaxID=236973 RepID=A0AAN7KET8_9MYRT|nr:hypothetical protein SAY87_002899 [Trapa incisa]
MNYFPDEVVENVFDYVTSHHDRNSISLVCKSWHRIERFSRQRVFIGNCYSISPEKGGHVYPWIVALAKSKVSLKALRLKRMVVSDESLELISRSFANFKSLVLVSCEGFTTNGLKSVAANCRLLRELDLQENEVEDHRIQWLNHFPESSTSLATLTLESLVAQSPNLKTLRVNQAVPLGSLQKILLRAPQLVDIGVGSLVHNPNSETFNKLKNTIEQCKSIRSLFLEVVPYCLPTSLQETPTSMDPVTQQPLDEGFDTAATKDPTKADPVKGLLTDAVFLYIGMYGTVTIKGCKK